MTRRNHTSAYSNPKQLLAQLPHFSANDVEQLDNTLRGQVKKLNELRKGTRTEEQNLKIRGALFEAIKTLDRAAPMALRAVTFPRYTKTDAPIGYSQGTGHLAALIDDYETNQLREVHSTTDTSKTAFARKARSSIEGLVKALEDQRMALQPRRPRLDPRRRDALTDIHFNLYATFARAMAASVEKDKSDLKARAYLEQLPHINQMAAEVQAFVAMLDLSKEVESVLTLCREQGDPEAFWRANRPQLKSRLDKAGKEFNAKIRELHLHVTAGDPGFRTIKHYYSYIEMERLIHDIEMFGSLQRIQEALKSHAFEFILGGEDKDAAEVHHKLFTRISKAYKEDKAVIAERARAHNYDSGSFDNPLTNNTLHTMNRVYEARWGLANDTLLNMLRGNFITVADTSIVAENDKRPSDSVGAAHIRRKRKPRQQELFGGDSGYVSSVVGEDAASPAKSR